MASIPLTLAALATSAVPDLTVFATRALSPNTEYAEAVIVSEDSELLVRVPRTHAAETIQRGELLGLAALTEGPRSQLPFSVPQALGITRAGQTRAVVTTYLSGGAFDVADLHDDSLLIESIARTIASIHALPTSVAQNGGLPERTANESRLAATRLIDRAVQTRLVPETVMRRWLSVVEDAQLWDFAPTMVHGTMSDEQLLIADDVVTGVLGWSACAVDDPALDFFWLLGANTPVLDAVLERYADLHNPGVLDKLRSRIALYHELEVARWLLQGTDSHDQTIIDDAVAMLDRLVGGGHTLASAVARARDRAPLSQDEAELILSETPEVIDFLSDTAAYEALDEDRVFGTDPDFREPRVDPDAATDPATAGDTGDAAADPADDASLATDVLTTDVIDRDALDEGSTDPTLQPGSPGAPDRR
ncbi:aminoglycoside phosphotransferase (APT) family kinase protein [Leucobacter exalbidus]|uniref:Aminoglycoside phosphotransferase (APT) family kinase protein n=1 Tax=Leucobacter exalbidus TaxID=662960 RepID=A0A940PRC5_9MICO|nr:phosphotransferase [Leucobacter exalbidus]MBP1324815.1 aminoglycoside phosphotransferase (APT) family kinase protein [Leucobacter exalbidus]